MEGDTIMRKLKFLNVFVFLILLLIVWKLGSIGSESAEQSDICKSNVSSTDAQFPPLTYVDYVRSNFVIYAVTPTYWRHVQKAELTRISQAIKLSRIYIHWIVVEDAEAKTVLVTNFLKESGLNYTHLNAKTPPFEKLKDKDPRWKKHRGVEQRNAGLNWIRQNLKNKEGVVYFMDDDNTYDSRIFLEMLHIKKVGVWPVGLAGGHNVETPVVDPKTGKVTGFRSGWKASREFAIDMAGFAINLQLILAKPEAVFSYKMEKGFQESEFLRFFTTKSELEPLANNCTKVYVWHTRTENPKISKIVPGIET